MAFIEPGSLGEVSRWSETNRREYQKGKPFPKGSKFWELRMADSQMPVLIYRHLLKKENKGKIKYSEEKLLRQAFKTLFKIMEIYILKLFINL